MCLSAVDNSLLNVPNVISKTSRDLLTFLRYSLFRYFTRFSKQWNSNNAFLRAVSCTQIGGKCQWKWHWLPRWKPFYMVRIHAVHCNRTGMDVLRCGHAFYCFMAGCAIAVSINIFFLPECNATMLLHCVNTRFSPCPEGKLLRTWRVCMGVILEFSFS